MVQKQNTVWYDKEGFKLVQYFPGFISDQLSMDIVTALENLIPRTNPHDPSIREQKHRHLGFQTWKQSLPLGTPCGVLRFNIHHQIGHLHHRPDISTDFAAGSSKRTEAACKSFGSRVLWRKICNFGISRF
jgi:hypothetical protein